ncbi:MAG: hypothetical protein ACRC46_04840 [Thermoguttaceae bacterium]
MNDTLPELANFGQPPREVTQTLRSALLLGVEPAAWLGTIFCVIGLLPMTIIALAFTLDDIIPRKWEPAGEATIVSIDRTNTHSNNRSVYAYHFRGVADGTSYGFEGVYNVNDVVPLERSRDLYRIEKLYLTSVGAVGPLFFLIFGLNGGVFFVVGLVFTLTAFVSGRRIVRLLREGDAVLARQTGVRNTSFRVNGRWVYKATLRYEVDGEEYTTYASSLDAEKLSAETHVVFYDRSAPSRGVAWSGLAPITIENDEWHDDVVRLTTTPWRAAMPMIALLFVAGAMVAFAVAVVRSL